MKKVFTEYVQEISTDDKKLRNELINIMMLKELSMKAVARECKIGYATIINILQENPLKKPRIEIKRKIAAWLETFHTRA